MRASLSVPLARLTWHRLSDRVPPIGHLMPAPGIAMVQLTDTRHWTQRCHVQSQRISAKLAANAPARTKPAMRILISCEVWTCRA